MYGRDHPPALATSRPHPLSPPCCQPHLHCDSNHIPSPTPSCPPLSLGPVEVQCMVVTSPLHSLPLAPTPTPTLPPPPACCQPLLPHLHHALEAHKRLCEQGSHIFTTPPPRPPRPCSLTCTTPLKRTSVCVMVGRMVITALSPVACHKSAYLHTRVKCDPPFMSWH